MKHPMKPYLYLTLIFTLISLACMSSAPTAVPPSQTPAPTELPATTPTPNPPRPPTATQTFPIPPSATVTMPVATSTNIPPTSTATGTPTTVVVAPTYPGFASVEVLPNDIFLQPATLPGNASERLYRPHGGNFGPCLTNPDNPPITGVYLEYPLLFLCDNEYEIKPVEITLTKPDGVTEVFTQEILSGERYCLDSRQTLAPGDYQFSVSGSGYSNSGSFTIIHTEAQIFVAGGGAYHFFEETCATLVTQSGIVEIFFAGFLPYQEVEVFLYVSPDRSTPLNYQTVWNATMDEQGQLVQYISNATFPDGQYFLLLVDSPEARTARGDSANPMAWNSLAYTEMWLPERGTP